MRGLEDAYLAEADPIVQSGFHGGPKRWREERGPILDAVFGDGDILDVGCANGFLLECLVRWAAERGITLTPHGVDYGPRLTALARTRVPAGTFHVANAWEWVPPRRYRYVYGLIDCVPEEFAGEYARRLRDRCVAPGGRLILGYYGSRSQKRPPWDMAARLRAWNLDVAGAAWGGDPPITSFAWTDLLA